MATIGLDIGTTGCKATAVDEEGKTIYEEYCEYDLIFPREGYVEISPSIVWQSVKNVLSKVLYACNTEVTSIAIASFGEAAVLLDKDDRPVSNSIFFTDIRGNDCIDTLLERFDINELQGKTGMPVNGMYTLLKLMWMKKNKPDLLDKTARILPFASYIIYQLTGMAVTDYSLASRTLLFNRQKLQWDREIIQKNDLDPGAFPTPIRSGKVIGQIRKSLESELSIKNNILVVSGGHDQVAAALGAGVICENDAVDGIGSAECITTILPHNADYKKLYKNNFCAEPYTIPGKYIALAFNNTAGAAQKWFRNNIEDELYIKCKEKGENIYKLLAENMADEPSPLLFLPYLAGSGTPYMDASAKGMLCGLTLQTHKKDIYRSLIEGMNFEMRYNLDLLGECGVHLNTLTAVGGGASSEETLRIKADILKLPIKTLENPQCGNMGLAMLCAVAEGQYSTVEDAVKALVKTKKIIEPINTYSQKYDDAYGSYMRMYKAMNMIYKG